MASEESLAFYDDTIRDYGTAPATRAIMRTLTNRGHYPSEDVDAFEWCRWDAANVARLLDEAPPEADRPAIVAAALIDSGVHHPDNGHDDMACLAGDVEAILAASPGDPQ